MNYGRKRFLMYRGYDAKEDYGSGEEKTAYGFISLTAFRLYGWVFKRLIKFLMGKTGVLEHFYMTSQVTHIQLFSEAVLHIA